MDWITNGFSFRSKNQIFEALKRHCGVGKKTFFKYLKELPNFTGLIKKLLQAEKHTQQDSNDQFTPLITKRMDRQIFLVESSSAHVQIGKKELLNSS